MYVIGSTLYHLFCLQHRDTLLSAGLIPPHLSLGFLFVAEFVPISAQKEPV